MAKMNVKESILINAPVDKVYGVLSNYSHWTVWSPWLILEPEAKVDVSEDKKYYEWVGERVGSGNMKITEEEENAWLNMDLTFLKPWKSKAKVRLEVQKEGEGTRVTWLMDSSLPFFLFFMKKMMQAFISSDFKRGLNLLKDYAEDGKVHSKLGFIGEDSIEGFNYIGIKNDSTMESVGPDMQQDFGRLGEYLSDKGHLISGKMLSIYHKWDMVKDKVSYTAAMPVSEVPSDLPSGFISGSMPSTRVFTVRHTGPYSHLGNAWAAQANLYRSKVYKSNKKIHPFEVYENTPMDTAETDLITDVKFAIK